jgi:hypothetical protein
MTKKIARNTPYKRHNQRRLDWNTRRQRPTVGALSLQSQSAQNQSDTWETTHEREREIMRNMTDFVAKKKIEHRQSDFYIMLLSRKEKLLANVVRDRLYCLRACPMPNYNQSLWKYHWKDDRLEFMWSVPPKEAVDFLKRYPLEMSDMCSDVIKCVFDFLDGTLARKTSELNKPNQPSLITMA